MDFVTDVYSGKINRCAQGQNRELSLQKKIHSRTGREGTKPGNGTQETNGFITTSFFTMLDVSLGKHGKGFPGGGEMGGGLQRLNRTVWHRSLVKSSFPFPLLLSGS